MVFSNSQGLIAEASLISVDESIIASTLPCHFFIDYKSVTFFRHVDHNCRVRINCINCNICLNIWYKDFLLDIKFSYSKTVRLAEASIIALTEPCLFGAAVTDASIIA